MSEKSESIPTGSSMPLKVINCTEVMDFFFLRIQLFVVEMIKQMSGEKIIDF